MFLIDTNVVSELRHGRKANPVFVSWAASAQFNEFYLSAMSIFEIERGILRIERRDPAQGKGLRSWIETQIIPRFQGRILPMDMDVARRAALLHVPDPMPERDAVIAATALVHNLTVVTRNVRDFEGRGIPFLNPWDIPAT